MSIFDAISVDPLSLRNELGIGNEKFVIGIIGVFDKCKGHIFLFRAIESLVSEGIKNILCLVVGDGREGNQLKDFIEQKKLTEYFKFLGYRNDIPKLLKTIDVVIVPSIQESFPRVPLEAMAMKVPVIATNVGGLSESIDNGNTGIIIPPANSNAIIKAIKYLMVNSEIRKQMGEAGRKRVETCFTLHNNIRETEALYLDVLNK
ncbi:glycosyl transferase, group 1 [Candidatus Magnetobacterium bavaricum]|uniref:Glycosyl transferase, group 1 n=1 Tax=Candidatus Magnetobacterium bavaricum TaxID=29290 RepID=A0A0F3GY32_9BACT|nr:glycosyl transferase, group 1 [Candidatus Magnetobacterium bavaricum]